jgi:DNA helicase II / ATP-dependent DNA helicase PcrA
VTFPGPDVLGRGLVIPPGAPVPPPFADVPRVVVDDAVLAAPEGVGATLHDAWDRRRRVVVELAVPADALRAPEAEERAPYLLDPGFTFARERLHFLVWANNYDARKSGEPVWWHGVRATRLGAGSGGPDGLADVALPGGTPAWCDGGPRRPLAGPGRAVVVHRDSIDAGRLTPAPIAHRPPQAELAPDQLAAVGHSGGPARIIAPAGSGKTRVLTERIRHLLLDRGYEPGLVTAVAYNVLAAEQLRERTAGFRPTIRTLNSLGLATCQRRGSWRVAEEPVQREILAGLIKSTGRAKTRGQRRVNTDPLAPYLDALSAIRLGLLPPERAEDLYPDAAGVAQVFPAYRAQLHAAGYLDFDEQIYLAVELLLADPKLRAEVRAEARTLLVDEFQDLTPAHLLLIRLVAGPAADVFGVGDDDQVIYGYAGADPGFLIDFGRYFPGAATYDLKVNYRCPPAVVAGARTLLGHNRRRLVKEIRPAPGRDGNENREALAVRLAPSDDLGPAAVEVVQEWAKEGVTYDDMAVLTRVNSSLLAVQVLLTEAGIPCRAAVGPWILERAGTAAILAYLRMAADPDRISRADVRATVRRPSRRISPKVIDMLARDATTSLRSIRGLAGWLADKDAFLRDAPRVEDFAADLASVADAVQRQGATTAAVFTLIRDEIGLGEAMETLDVSKGTLDRSSNGDDLAALLQVAALHPDPSTFEVWLRDVLTARGGATGTGVHLATVHRVKGREWPRVAVFGADTGLFPHRLAGDVEEERRIFHVAITRAREQAVVLADAAAPSPFVLELTQAAAAGLAGATASLRATALRAPAPKPAKLTPAAAVSADIVHATPGLLLALRSGRPEVEVVEVRRGEAVVSAGPGSGMVTVELGTEVRVEGRARRLVAPAERVAAATAALAAWRTAKAKAEGKPPYVFLSNAHIADIAERDPDTPARLARCRGIGPAKLEAYGEEILNLLE